MHVFYNYGVQNLWSNPSYLPLCICTKSWLLFSLIFLQFSSSGQPLQGGSCFQCLFAMQLCVHPSVCLSFHIAFPPSSSYASSICWSHHLMNLHRGRICLCVCAHTHAHTSALCTERERYFWFIMSLILSYCLGPQYHQHLPYCTCINTMKAKPSKQCTGRSLMMMMTPSPAWATRPSHLLHHVLHSATVHMQTLWKHITHMLGGLAAHYHVQGTATQSRILSISWVNYCRWCLCRMTSMTSSTTLCQLAVVSHSDSKLNTAFNLGPSVPELIINHQCVHE